MNKKKLQVFVSSTYSDLIAERQAAVEAILAAGHIPAGMELFAAGDESQLEVIRRWIEESDVFLLILGGRYGSIEPRTQKSYIQLEYEYAIERQRPVFAVVLRPEDIEARVKTMGVVALETERSNDLRSFRTLVESRMVRYWRDPKDIQLTILKTLSEFAERSDISGWVRASESVNLAPITEEVARLSKENAILRDRLALITGAGATYNGLSFDDLYAILADTPLSAAETGGPVGEVLSRIANNFGDNKPGLVHLFWRLSARLVRELDLKNTPHLESGRRLEEFGLVTVPHPGFSSKEFILSEVGRQFLLRLRKERNVLAAEDLRM
jgi:hypothetical protein